MPKAAEDASAERSVSSTAPTLRLRTPTSLNPFIVPPACAPCSFTKSTFQKSHEWTEPVHPYVLLIFWISCQTCPTGHALGMPTEK